MVTTDEIKKLRDETGVSVMQCKKALEEAGGDAGKALIILRKKSADIAAKKSDRTLGAGVVASYVHNTGTVGAMVVLSSETDFVSKNEEFKKLAYDIAMQVAAANPEYLSKEDVPKAEMEKAREVFLPEVAGKPENMKEQILQGKLDAYFKDKILLEQPFIKNPEVSVGTLIAEATQKFGERVAVSQFSRFKS